MGRIHEKSYAVIREDAMSRPLKSWEKQRVYEKLVLDLRRIPGLHPYLADRISISRYRQMLKRMEKGEDIHVPTLVEIYGKEAVSRMRQPRWANRKVRFDTKLRHARRLAMKYRS